MGDMDAPKSKVPSCTGCLLANTGPAQRCRVHGCAVCGGVMLADSEDYPHATCPEHFEAYVLGFADAQASGKKPGSG